MTIRSMCSKLQKHGLDARPVTMCDGSPAIMVYHDYDGPYPTRATFNAHDRATAYARRHGYQAEQRGHYTATLIREV